MYFITLAENKQGYGIAIIEKWLCVFVKKCFVPRIEYAFWRNWVLFILGKTCLGGLLHEGRLPWECLIGLQNNIMCPHGLSCLIDIVKSISEIASLSDVILAHLLQLIEQLEQLILHFLTITLKSLRVGCSILVLN